MASSLQVAGHDFMQRIREMERGAKPKFVYRQSQLGVHEAPRSFWAPEGRRRDGVSALARQLCQKNAPNLAVYHQILIFKV